MRVRYILRTGRYLLMLFTVLCLPACVTTEGFQHMMDSQVGMHIDDLRNHYGYNYIERELPDGRRAFTWTWVERGVTPAYRSPDIIRTYRSSQGQEVYIIPGAYFPPEFYETNCEFSFIIDSTGRAISWRAHGNGCAGYSGPGDVLQPAPKKTP